MLNKDINKRFSLQQIINHEWIVKMKIIINEKRDIYDQQREKFIKELNKVNLKNINFNELGTQYYKIKIESISSNK